MNSETAILKSSWSGRGDRPAMPFSQPRVAIVHYWLVAMRGGERVVERLLRLYPGADLFTHVYDPSSMSKTIRDAKVSTTFIDRLPFSRRAYQYYLPFMPMALEGLDLRNYDLVISSESGPAKGVITGPDSLHVCYTHSPMRYIWDHYHLYRETMNPLVKAVMPPIYHRLRQWDMSSSARVDRFVANSTFIRNRISKSWRREAEVIHPPVDIEAFSSSKEVDDYYLWVGQMVPYKRPDIAVDAFNKTGKKLLMVGNGSMLRGLREQAGPNISFAERLDFASLKECYSRCRALVFTAEEDFGIVPVEAMASGRPVLAYGKGGVRDSIAPEVSGLLFHEQTPEALIEGLETLEAWLPHFDRDACVGQARLFAPERFDEKMLKVTQP